MCGISHRTPTITCENRSGFSRGSDVIADVARRVARGRQTGYLEIADFQRIPVRHGVADTFDSALPSVHVNFDLLQQLFIAAGVIPATIPTMPIQEKKFLTLHATPKVFVSILDHKHPVVIQLLHH